MPRYEFVEGSSSKFWQIDLDGTSFTTTYGRLGTDGQSSMKEYDSEEKAKKEYDKLIAEKTKKGYKLVSGGGAAAAAAKPAAAKKKPFDDEGDDEDEAPKKKPAAKPAAATASAGGGKARRFEFVEGSSSKFWEIQLEGTSFTTRYGRLGTDGQMSMKEYDSVDKAKKEYDKLVAEKTKKGYVEK